MADSIRQSPATNLVGTPTPTLKKDLFDGNIWGYGYEVLVDKAIECPCKQSGKNSNQINCQNCRGTGWVFINPVKTKAIITSINQDTKYKPWSQELIGNISITFRDIDNVAFMDRITLIDESTIFSQICPIRTATDATKFIFAAYGIESIEDIFVFAGESSPLVKLTSDKYSISTDNPFVVEFTTNALSSSINNSVSIRYKHKIQYNILDMPHVVRSSPDLNNLGQLKKQKLPTQYIARLSHYVVQPNYDGSGIIDNSY